MVTTNLIKFVMQGMIGTIKAFNGTEYDCGYFDYFYNLTNNAYYTNNTKGMYIDVGFGNTPETSNDYRLADSNAIGDNAGKLTWISSVQSAVYPSLRTVISSYRNNTNEDVTIREIGIVQKNSSSNYMAKNSLMTRKVLESPVVVHPGETVTFTEAIELE